MRLTSAHPGGEETIQALADLLDVEPQPLDAEHGTEKAPVVAWIREAECIGCTKCIQACPVDAILGACESDAYGHCRRVHRLRPLLRPLPCGLY
jgi:electron transport complex protein RnfB